MSESVRPTSVTVIGWAWVVVGFWMAIAGAGGLLTSSFMGAATFFSAPFEWVFPAGLAFQVVAGASGVVLGASLLRLVRWAYFGIQWLIGLVLLYIGAIALFLFWMAFTGFVAGSYLMAGGVLAVGLWTAAASGIPLVLMLRSLRKEPVRALFAAPV